MSTKIGDPKYVKEPEPLHDTSFAKKIVCKDCDLKKSPSILKYFRYKHLPPKLQDVSRPFGDLVRIMDRALPDGPEKSAGLRKLLEAKDCMVRAALEVD